MIQATTSLEHEETFALYSLISGMVRDGTKSEIFKKYLSEEEEISVDLAYGKIKKSIDKSFE